MNENEKNNYEKARYYFNKKISVHVSLNDKTFYNGTIISFNESRIIIADEKLGEVLILLSEVFKIEPREVKG